MATEAFAMRSAQGMSCKKCGHFLAAPEWLESFSEEGLIINFWRCAKCGNYFETETPAAVETRPMIDADAAEGSLPRVRAVA